MKVKFDGGVSQGLSSRVREFDLESSTLLIPRENGDSHPEKDGGKDA